MFVRFGLRLPVCALFALGACGLAAPANDDMGTDWLVGQYFGDRQTVVLPDLNASISVSVGIYEPEAPSAPRGPIDFRAGHGVGDAPGQYYPFLHSVTDGGEYAVPYPAGDAAAIVDGEASKVGELTSIVRGAANFLRLNAVRLDVIGRLADLARARKWTVVFSTARCVVVSIRGRQPDQRVTSVFVGGDGPVWDLNDTSVERCALAGVLQAFGMDVPNVMVRADTLYPHRSASNSCPLAVARASLIQQGRDWRNGLRCKSRARAAWPFEVLRRAVATGKLKAGPISRVDFAATLADTASSMGGERRRKIASREEEMLRLAAGDEISNPRSN